MHEATNKGTLRGGEGRVTKGSRHELGVREWDTRRGNKYIRIRIRMRISV